MPFEPLYVAVALLVGGVIAVALGVRWRSELALEPRGWSAVDGTIVDVRRSPGGPDEYFPVVEYLAPDGRRLRLHGMASGQAASGQTGQVVQVLVDPADASRARLAEAYRGAGSLARTSIVGGVALVAIGMGLVLALR